LIFSNEIEGKKLISGGVTEKPKDKTPPPQEKVLTLDDLFRKTVAKPAIYYLPLTDNDIELKKKAAAEAKSKEETKPNQETNNR